MRLALFNSLISMFNGTDSLPPVPKTYVFASGLPEQAFLAVAEHLNCHLFGRTPYVSLRRLHR